MKIECATLYPPPAERAGSQQLTAASLLIYYTARKDMAICMFVVWYPIGLWQSVNT